MANWCFIWCLPLVTLGRPCAPDPASAQVKLDPLAQMRERLEAQRAAGAPKYQVAVAAAHEAGAGVVNDGSVKSPSWFNWR